MTFEFRDSALLSERQIKGKDRLKVHNENTFFIMFILRLHFDIHRKC
jgi:hypothetical protein